MVGDTGSVSGRTRGRRNNVDDEENDEIVILNVSDSESEMDEENDQVDNEEEEDEEDDDDADEEEEEEEQDDDDDNDDDSDDTEILMLYEEKVDLTNMEKRGGEVGMQKGKKEVKNLKKKEKEVDQVCSAKLAQEAMFFANKASEKFLELYSREAYACAFLDRQLPYDHPSSESKSNFDFLSGLPADWATIEVFARAMKVRQLEKIAKDPVKSKSSSAKGKSTAEESPDDQPSALNIVSGLKLMSLLQGMNMLTFDMISRRNARQILKDLEGVAAANPTRRASDKVDQAETSGAKAQKETDQSSKDGPDITAVWALMNL